jgi:metal-sulfur cluster biosynthetic enzyme
MGEPMTQNATHTDDAALTEPPMTQGCPSHPLWPRITAALRSVYDPEIPVNIYELGLIYTVSAADRDAGEGEEGGTGGRVADLTVTMTLTSPGCPVAQEMPGWVQSALMGVPGVGDVDVALVWEPPWSPEAMSETAKMELNLFGGGMY